MDLLSNLVVAVAVVGALLALIKEPVVAVAAKQLT
jgi:hypothetical protein